MNSDSVANCTLIIRSQVEYSTAVQAVIQRCILEVPDTGKRRGFTDVDALLAAVRTELVELQRHIIPSDMVPPDMIPPDTENLENVVHRGRPPAPSGSIPSKDADRPEQSDAIPEQDS